MTEMHQPPTDRPGFFFRGIPLILGVTALLLALNVAVFYGIFFSSLGIPGYRRQRQQVEALAAKAHALRKENHRLFSKIQGLKNDPLAQEKLVRQQLGWTRENELVIEFPVPPEEQPR